MDRKVLRLIEVLTRAYSHFAVHSYPDAALLLAAANWAAAGQLEAARLAVLAFEDCEYRPFYGEEADLMIEVGRALEAAALPESVPEEEEEEAAS